MLRTSNKQDFLLGMGAAGGADPVVEYVLLGKNLNQGVFSWINFAVDPKKRVRARPATICSADGCKANAGGMFGLSGFGAPKAGGKRTGKTTAKAFPQQGGI
jgi:hypothetical protein